MTAPTPVSATPPTDRKPSGQRWPAIWGRRLWALIALALGLLVYRVWVVHHSGISLFFDEAQYWDWSRNLQWGYYSKPPAIAALIRASTTVFGDGIIGVKLLSMLLYPATALAMVGLARALWPTSSGVRTGVVAGALFLCMPMVGTMGLFASTDAPLLLCWTLAAWALWRAQVTDRLQHWALLGLACGVGILSKYTMAAFAITALWALWGVHGPRRGLWRMGPWVAIGLTLLIISPNLVWNAHNGFPTLQHTAELTTESEHTGGTLALLTFAGGQLLMLGPVAIVAAAWLWFRGQRAAPMPTTSGSQWATSTQVSPPSQWAHTAAMGGPSLAPGSTPQRKVAARTSAYHLASVSSYHFLWVLSLPLLVIASAQAFMGGAHVNWAAPAMVGFTMLLASLLSAPLVPLAAPRPRRWLWAILLSNVALTSLALHARDLLPAPVPARLDALVRMRGWQEAFQQLEPVITEPRIAGLPVLADQRLLITQALYNWRHHKVRAFYWNPDGLRDNHYLLQHSLPNKIGPDVLLVTGNAKPDDITSRFAIVRPMKSVRIEVAENRFVEVHTFFLRGFLGYTQQAYMDQAGGGTAPTMDTP